MQNLIIKLEWATSFDCGFQMHFQEFFRFFYLLNGKIGFVKIGFRIKIVLENWFWISISHNREGKRLDQRIYIFF